MRKKKYLYPRPALKDLANDIARLIKDNQGRIRILEMIDELPFDTKPEIIETLGTFHREEMAGFFHLLKMEYGVEMEKVCNRVLEKYRMSGLDITAPVVFEGSFHKAYASCSRHTGRITLDVAWVTGPKGLHVECFYLTYNPDGIHSFVLLENLAPDQYKLERDHLPDMTEVSFAEACFLIKEAYSNNIRYMSRPAIGRFLYQKYLEFNLPQSIDGRELTRRLSAAFNPRTLINSFFYGLKQQDYNYLAELVTIEREADFYQRLEDLLCPGSILLEAYAREVDYSGQKALVSAYVVTLRDYLLTASRLSFSLTRDADKNWYISDFAVLDQENLGSGSKANLFNTQVQCRVYYITGIDELFDILEKVDNLQGIDELPYGIHMRITETRDDFSSGVAFLNGVIADIVINNGEELVIISKFEDTIRELHSSLCADYESPVIPIGSYQIDMLTAYKYIGGQYTSFEDILSDDSGDISFDDGMRLISARYFVKDREKVADALAGLQDMTIEVAPDYDIYYQFTNKYGATGYLAEYLLTGSWLSISAFGENDLRLARQDFEAKMQEYLEFDGLESKRSSIFDVLNPEIKKEYPQLEKALKEVYLNKWYYSGLSLLRGMSPSEASQTEEGNRLLWSMFKKIKQKDSRGSRRRIQLSEYIRKLEQKKEEKHRS